MLKKNKALVFIVNKSYLFALGAMLINLKKESPDLYDEVVVYYDDLTQHDMQTIEKLESRIKFVRYNFEDWEKEHVKVTSKNALNFLERYSHLAWSKYKIIEQLYYYNKVLYLDLDMIVRGDISELFTIDGFAWRSGNNFLSKFGKRIEKEAELKSINSETSTPNGGLIYVSGHVDIDKCLKNGRDFLVKHLDKFTGGVDELVLGWIVHNNKIPLTQLDPYTYNSFPQMLKKQTKIVHFMGSEKPWNSDLMQTIFPQWLEYYYKSVEVSGLQSNVVTDKNNGGDVVKAFLNQKRWLNFFEKTKFSCPKDLELTRDLSKEWLIINNDHLSYYEFKFNQYLPNYMIGMWLKGSHITNDKSIQQRLETLKNESNIFKYDVSDKGIYIYTDRIPESNINSVFEYFYKKTKNIVN